MVSPVTITNTFNGDISAANYVNAAALDTQLTNLATTINSEIAERQRTVRDGSGLASQVVRFPSLHPEITALLTAGGLIPIQSAAVAALTNSVLVGLLTIDGYTLLVNDRVLLTGQTNPLQNGLWVAAAGAWSRPSDSLAGAALARYTFIGVTNGTALSGSQWFLNAAATVDITAQSWLLYSALSTVLPIARGGTGATTAPAALTNLGLTAYAQTLIAAATAAAARTVLGIPTSLLLESIATRTFVGRAAGGTGVASALNMDDLTVLSDGSSTIRDLSARFGEVFNVKDFGAVGDGITDDTAAIQACLTAGGHIWLPPGTYLCGALTCAKRIFMHGAGAWQSIIRSTVNGGTTALTINPPNTGSSNTFYRLMNFSIEPSTATNGLNGIAVVLAASCYFSNFLIDGVYIGDFGGYGLRLDNTVANANGFFTGTVRRCWITNGINGIKIGDSITFRENTITGRNIGLLISSLSGAREIVIVENNITCRGGALAAFTVDGMRVRNNQMEQPAVGYNGPYDAFVYLSACNYVQIESNTISPGSTPTPASYAILSTGAGLSNLVDKNDISKGNVYHLLVDTGQVNFIIGEFNNYDVTAVIGDSGTTTKRIINGSATYDPPSLADGVGTTTTVTVSGAALGDQVAAVSFSLDLQGIIVSGYISSANVATVRFQNETGGVLDLASGTLRVRARKQ